MKRAFAPIALLAVAVTLAACGSDDDDIASPAVVGADSIASTEAPEPDHPTASNAPAASDANAPPASAATGFVFGSMPCPDAEGAELPTCSSRHRSASKTVAATRQRSSPTTARSRSSCRPTALRHRQQLRRAGEVRLLRRLVVSPDHRGLRDPMRAGGGQDEGSPGYRIPDELPRPGRVRDASSRWRTRAKPNQRWRAQWFIIAETPALPSRRSTRSSAPSAPTTAARRGRPRSTRRAAAHNGVPPSSRSTSSRSLIIEG
jgi:predicted small lipoprotein YifL